ncbi:MAG: hypothetical protein J6W52_07925 [Bacteroidaceae bacterium]|nr:hypothetical protein [Bacteroidaceae bacterium]
MKQTVKTAIIVTALLVGNSHLKAQDADSTRLRPTFELEYTTELQTDFTDANWANLLQLRAAFPISRKFSFNVSSVSVVATDEEPLAEELQGFSNITAWNIPFALSVAGFTWHINDCHSLFAGIRRMDEDYFCSDDLSLFTNASCGGFPTITANYAIPVYPMAAMGIHYAYDSKKLKIQASLYNGTGSYEFTGRNNVFRICPQSDGIFALGQVEYRHRGSRYYLGASLHDWDLLGIGERKPRPSTWIYAEQVLGGNFTLLAAYSHAFSSDELCNDFFAIGGKYTFKKAELGIFSDYTRIIGIDEWATELTCKIALTNYLSLQPALHIITTDDITNCIGMLRLNVCL